MSLVSSALWKLKLRSCSQLPLKKTKTNHMSIKAPVGKFLHSCLSAPPQYSPMPNNWRPHLPPHVFSSPPSRCPFQHVVRFMTRVKTQSNRQNQPTSPSLLVLSEEMKAELLTHNTVCSSCFPPREESKGNGCDHCPPTLWEWKGNPF